MRDLDEQLEDERDPAECEGEQQWDIGRGQAEDTSTGAEAEAQQEVAGDGRQGEAGDDRLFATCDGHGKSPGKCHALAMG